MTDDGEFTKRMNALREAALRKAEETLLDDEAKLSPADAVRVLDHFTRDAKRKGCTFHRGDDD